MSTNTPLVQKYFQLVVTRPWTVIALSAIALFASAAFLPTMVMDTRSDAFIDPAEPALVYREKVEELFGLADPIVIAVTNDSNTGIYNPDSLLLVQWLTEQVQQLPNVDPERVVSLATEANIVGTEEGMEIEDFFEESPGSPARVAWIKQAIENFPLYQGSLVARDHSATLIVAELLDEFEADETYAEILAISNRAPVGANDRVHVAGEGAIAGYLAAYIDADAQKLNPLAAVVITTVLFIAFLTVRGAVLPNIVVLGTVGATFGLMAAFGVPFFVITNGLTVSLIAMAVADSIHIFSQYYIEQRREPGASQPTLVMRAMMEMWQPITLTTVTTAAGFLTLYLTSSMPPIQFFGLFGGIGVTLAWIFSVTFLPAVLSLLKPKASRTFATAADGSPDWASALMTRVGRVVLGYPRSVLAVGAVVAVVAVIGAVKVTVEEVRIANFQGDEPIYLADAAMNASMDGVYHLDVLVETEDYEGLHRPEHLRRIDRLQRFLETQPGVGGTTSVVDYIKQMHRAVNENRADTYSIPDDALLISQLFLLYSASADPTDFEEEVDGEYRQALVRAKIDNGSYLRNKPVIEAARAYLRDEFNTPGITGTLTGRVNVDHYWIEEIGGSHARSVGFAFLVVALVVIVLFRSVAAGIITTIPVAMAILLIYAWMGISNVWLGVGTTMFAAIAIGLCVDFTIHTVDRLRDLLRDLNGDGGAEGEVDAVKNAMFELYPSTGRALFYNLAAIALGFGVLITSDVPPLNNFGTLVGLAVVVAFVSSVTLLPALIYLTRPAFIFSPSSARIRPGLVTASVIVLGLVSLVAFTDTFADTGVAQIDALNGQQIMQAVNARDDGERVSRDLRIELTDRRGKVRVQETRGFRRYFGEEKRTVIFYRAPSNIRDTAFLTFDYPDAEVDDDQWLYLPALRKVRRISASDRGDYFLGTDFTYEEIKKENKIEIDDYRLTRTGAETVDGHECIVVEGKPRSRKIAKELGYGKVVWRVDPAIWMSRSSDYWDVNGNHLKTIATPVIEQIDGIWTALKITAANHKTRHRSAFTFSNVDYSTDVPEKLFGQRSLTRGL